MMSPLNFFQLICFLVILLNNSDAFHSPIKMGRKHQHNGCSFIRTSFGRHAVFSSVGPNNSNNEIDEKSSSMSYDEADVKLKSEDEKRRLDNQGFGLTDEVRRIECVVGLCHYETIGQKIDNNRCGGKKLKEQLVAGFYF